MYYYCAFFPGSFYQILEADCRPGDWFQFTYSTVIRDLAADFQLKWLALNYV